MKLTDKEFRDFYDKVYAYAGKADLATIEQIEQRVAFGQRAKQQAIKCLLSGEIKRFVDIGCGIGRNTIFLLENLHPKETFGIDIAYGAVSIWTRRMKRKGLNAKTLGIIGDAQKLPFRSNSIDLVLCFEVLEHLPDDEACLSEISRVLTKDGICFLTVPHSYIPLFSYLRGKKAEPIESDVTSIITNGPPGEDLQTGGDLRWYTLAELKTKLHRCGLTIHEYRYVQKSFLHFSFGLSSLLVGFARELLGVKHVHEMSIFQEGGGSKAALAARIYKRFLTPIFNAISDMDKLCLGKLDYGSGIVLKIGKTQGKPL